MRLSDAEARARVAVWAPSFRPVDVYPGATKPWVGECADCGAQVQPTFHSLQQGRGHCRDCGRKRSVESRRLSDADAQARAAEYAPNFVPHGPYPGNNQKPWPGVCRQCGRDISPTFAIIQQRGSACPFCARKKVDPDEAFRVYVESGGTPKVPYPGKNDVPWPGVCNACGVEVAPTWANVRKPGRGVCNACAKRASARSRVLDPDAAALALTHWGFEPLEPYPGRAAQPWLIRHRECGVELRRSYNYVQQGHGCPECSNYFYSLDAPGFFYVVASADWLKPGVTNVPKRRLAEHRMQGLTEVLHLVEFPNGREALGLEKQWLSLRSERVAVSLWPTVDDVPNGYTEAVARTPETEVLVELLIR